jgi:hypothetical protein
MIGYYLYKFAPYLHVDTCIFFFKKMNFTMTTQVFLSVNGKIIKMKKKKKKKKEREVDNRNVMNN